MIKFNFEEGAWERVEPNEGPLPIPRAGHSAVMYDGKMYVFGGKDEDNEKLKDFWRFDFKTKIWKEL